jgi:hypothetical protein
MNPDHLRNTLLLAAAASMASIAAAYDDGAGKSWRQLTDSQVLSWSQIAAVCPVGGVSPCKGRVGDIDFSGWTWATQQQVMDLFNRVLPEDPKRPNRGKLSIDHPGIGAGVAYFGLADHFLSNAFAPTSSFCVNYDCGEAAIGWTASQSRNGKAILGAVSWYRTPEKLDGNFSVDRLMVTNEAYPEYGVWLWRPVAGVPEPATSWLLAGGGLALLLRGRLRSST